MKISEMIEKLQKLYTQNGDIELISSIDSEGNGYNQIRGVDFVYSDAELEFVYDTTEEAEENGVEKEELVSLGLVWV